MDTTQVTMSIDCCMQINQDVRGDLERWSTLNLNISSRMGIAKMNILPWLSYLFQSLPAMISQKLFTGWD